MDQMGKIVNIDPPYVPQGRVSWHVSRWFLPRLGLLEAMKGTLTLWDSFGTPGDTLLAGAIARIIVDHYPRLKINCVTPNPEVLREDPNIKTLNAAPDLVVLRFWYLEIIHRKDGETNLLAPTLSQLGIKEYGYRSKVFLTLSELEWAFYQLRFIERHRSLITINVQSREKLKVWAVERWVELVSRLAARFEILQLGASDEPEIPGVTRFAGRLTLRESMAILSQAQLHVGGVSFLMHAANGLNVPSVIIYGGRETPKNSGYSTNINLYAKVPCSPCWLHDSHGDRCENGMKCMNDIGVDQVFESCVDLLLRNERK